MSRPLSEGYAAKVNGLFLTKKGEFAPFSDNVKVSPDAAAAAAEKTLGALLPGSYTVTAVKVRRMLVQIG